MSLMRLLSLPIIGFLLTTSLGSETIQAQSIRLKELWTIDGQTSETDALGTPGNIVFDRKGGVYFLDRQVGVIRHLDSEGNRRPDIGRSGSGPGEFGRGSHRMTFNPTRDTLFVLDYPNSRIIWFTGDHFLQNGSIPVGGNRITPGISHGLVVRRNDFVLTGAAADNHIVHRFSREGAWSGSEIALIDYENGIDGNHPSPSLKTQFNRGQLVPIPRGYWFVLNTPYTMVRVMDGIETHRLTDPFIEAPWERYVRTTPNRYEVDNYPGTWLAERVGSDRFLVVVGRPREPNIIDIRSIHDGQLLSRTVIPLDGFQILGAACEVTSTCRIGLFNHRTATMKIVSLEIP